MPASLRALAVLVLLGAAVAARADDKETAALKNMDEGWALFVKGDLAAARARFAAAQQAFPDKPNPYRLLGLVDARLHQCQDAVRELDQFISRIQPDDPRYAEAVTVRDQCKDELTKSAPATLVVRSNPAAAAVSVDGAAAGDTPLQTQVPPGAHTVRLEKPSFQPFQQRLQLAPGESRTLDALLVAAAPPAAQHKWLWIGIGTGAAVVVLAALVTGLAVGLHSSDPFETSTKFPPVASP